MTAATEILQMPAAKAPEPAERGGAMALREQPEVVLGPADPRSPVGDVLLPQWVAQAGVRAFRPFIAERPTQWMVLLPRSRAGIATVVATRTSGLSILGQDQGPNRWSLFWRRGSLYEIDLGLHHTWFEVELPSQVDMFAFRAHVAVEWRVCDAVQVVKDHVWDVREVLRPALVALLAHDTRIFRVDQVFEAERAVAAALHGNDIGKGYGLETNLRIQLSADPGAAEHAAERRGAAAEDRDRGRCSSTTVVFKKPTRSTSSRAGSACTGRSSQPVTSTSSPCSWRATRKRSRPSSKWCARCGRRTTGRSRASSPPCWTPAPSTAGRSTTASRRRWTG